MVRFETGTPHICSCLCCGYLRIERCISSRTCIRMPHLHTMECVTCICTTTATDNRPVLLTCGHICCERCLGPNLVYHCTACEQLVIVATRLFVTEIDTSLDESDYAGGSTGTSGQNTTTQNDGQDGLRGKDAEACLSTTIQCVRNFTENHLSSMVQGHLRQKNETNRRTVAAKMSTYFQLRQRNIHLQKQSTDMFADIERGQRSLKDAKRQLARENARLERNRRMHRQEVDRLKLAIARTSQRAERRLRHVRFPLHQHTNANLSLDDLTAQDRRPPKLVKRHCYVPMSPTSQANKRRG
ncbi:hypothetical protein LXA43DRAFT_1065529 [Ganoderma leucocontextum]|nr:hypothetical protein LXA43DRAFT_1065529 [Ganoderma leucocontextum]